MKEETKIWVISVDEDPMPWEYWDLPHSVFTGTEKDAESYRLGLEANNPKEWLWLMCSTQRNTIQSNVERTRVTRLAGLGSAYLVVSIATLALVVLDVCLSIFQLLF